MKPHTPEPTPFEQCPACRTLYQAADGRPCDCDLSDTDPDPDP